MATAATGEVRGVSRLHNANDTERTVKKRATISSSFFFFSSSLLPRVERFVGIRDVREMFEREKVTYASSRFVWFLYSLLIKFVFSSINLFLFFFFFDHCFSNRHVTYIGKPKLQTRKLKMFTRKRHFRCIDYCF